MNENQNDKPLSQPAPDVVTPKELNRRIAVLKAELAFDFPGLLEQLEAGVQMILVSHSRIERSFHPDWLQRVGGMTLLCHHYGAAVLFVDSEKVLKVGDGL